MTLDPIVVAAQIFRRNRYLTLATCAGEAPWAAPLAYTVDPDFTLVFYTALEARHTQHFLKNPLVAGAIFDSTLSSDDADGLQFSGTCAEVFPETLQETMKRYFEASFPDQNVREKWLRPVADFRPPAPQRFFRIMLRELGKIDPASQKVDRRLSLNIQKVRLTYEKL